MSVRPRLGGGPDRRAVSPLPPRGARSGADPGRPCPCRTDRRRRQLEGCGAVRVGPSTSARGAGSPTRAAATPRGHRAERGHPPCTANHQPHHQDGLVPLCCHRRAYTRSSWGLACQSGRLGPDTVGPARAGPCVAPSPTAPRLSSPALRLTRPLAYLPRHAVPATSLAGDSDAPALPAPGGPVGHHGRLGRTSGGTGRRAPGDHGQVGTRTLVTAGHRRHVTRWPLMTSHEPCHAIARQLLGATRIHGPDSHRLKPLHR